METMNRMSNMPPDSEAKDKVNLWLVTLGCNVCALYVVDLYALHPFRQNMTSQETCSHTTQHLSSSRSADTRQGESILSCCLCHTLTLPSKCWSRNQATFFRSSIVQFRSTCVNFSLHLMFLADMSDTWCGLLLQMKFPPIVLWSQSFKLPFFSVLLLSSLQFSTLF